MIPDRPHDSEWRALGGIPVHVWKEMVLGKKVIKPKDSIRIAGARGTASFLTIEKHTGTGKVWVQYYRVNEAGVRFAKPEDVKPAR